MRNNNEESNQVMTTTKEEELAIAERKADYEEMGIPVNRLWFCHGLPMTSQE